MTPFPARAAGEVVRLTAAVPPPLAGGGRVLAVDGPSGAGKSTLAAAVAAALEAPLLPLEDLYPGWDGLAEGVERLVEWVLRPLAEGRTARWRAYDWTRGRYTGRWRELAPVPLLVVEGVGTGALAAAPYLSCLVWVSAPEAVRKERALARDGATYRPHWERWARQERELFARDRIRERADLVVANG